MVSLPIQVITHMLKLVDLPSYRWKNHGITIVYCPILLVILGNSCCRNTSVDEVKKLCSTIQDEFYDKDKSAECMALLRQLFFILQATDTEHR